MLVHECLVGAAETAATPKRAAWVWQGCHTLLICAHPCILWEALLRQKLLWEDVWWLRGYGRMPYPPNPLSVGVFVGGNVRFV